MKPLISIITPVYNAEKTIGDTIESVIKQTVTDFEMIIVDDISSDNTIEIIKDYQKKDKRIKLIVLDKKGGASAARNRALKEAKGRYIAFLDGDDLWKENKLEIQLKFMQDNNCAFSYTDYEYIDDNNKKLGIMRKSPRKVSYFRMLLGDSIGCLTVMYDALKVGKIQIPNIKKRNDYALWCQILKRVKVGYKCNSILALYRKGGESLSSGKKIGLLKYHYQMHRNINKFNPVVSLFLTFTNIVNYISNKLFKEKKITSKKIGILGHFAFKRNFTDGQTVKTKNLYEELCKLYGSSEINVVDTYNWKKNPLKLLINCIRLHKNSRNVIILPARNGIKVFVPLFTYLNKICNRKLFYAVVGGWLPELISKNPKLQKQLKIFDKILVETNGIIKKLNKLELNNVDILFNFKHVTILDEKTITYNKKNTYKLCTFSRVIKEKGIENAINAVKIVNEKLNNRVFKLDIYGPIGDEYKERFDKIINENADFVAYKGIVDSQKSVDTLKKYDFLLFPTYYDGEGFAGTIIDAFSAAVPVVASDWKYNKDVIKNMETGFIFKTRDDLELALILENIYNNKYDILKIKKNCIQEVFKYRPSEAIKGLTKYLDD